MKAARNPERVNRAVVRIINRRVRVDLVTFERYAILEAALAHIARADAPIVRRAIMPELVFKAAKSSKP